MKQHGIMMRQQLRGKLYGHTAIWSDSVYARRYMIPTRLGWCMRLVFAPRSYGQLSFHPRPRQAMQQDMR